MSSRSSSDLSDDDRQRLSPATIFSSSPTSPLSSSPESVSPETHSQHSHIDNESSPVAHFPETFSQTLPEGDFHRPSISSSFSSSLLTSSSSSVPYASSSVNTGSPDVYNHLSREGSLGDAPPLGGEGFSHQMSAFGAETSGESIGSHGFSVATSAVAPAPAFHSPPPKTRRRSSTAPLSSRENRSSTASTTSSSGSSSSAFTTSAPSRQSSSSSSSLSGTETGLQPRSSSRSSRSSFSLPHSPWSPSSSSAILPSLPPPSTSPGFISAAASASAAYLRSLAARPPRSPWSDSSDSATKAIWTRFASAPSTSFGRAINKKTAPIRAVRSQLSLTAHVHMAQLTGRATFKTPRTLSRAVLKGLDRDYDDFPSTLVGIDRLLDQEDWAELKPRVKALTKALLETPDPAAAVSSFLLFDGPLFLKRVLLAPTPRLPLTAATALEVRNEAMASLREAAYASSHAAKYLAGDSQFIVDLFRYLRFPTTFDNAVGVIEALLAAGSETLDLGRVEGLPELLDSFSTRQMAFFCRILALVVFEPDDRLKSAKSNASSSVAADPLTEEQPSPTQAELSDSSLEASSTGDASFDAHDSSDVSMAEAENDSIDECSGEYQAHHVSPATPTSPPPAPGALGDTTTTSFPVLPNPSPVPVFKKTDRNQAILVSHVGLLDKLVALLRAQNIPTSRWTQQLLTHFHSTQDLLSVLVGLDEEDDWHQLDNQAEANARANSDDPMFSLKVLTLASHQVEVLFVICNLLSGKGKVEVQDALGRLGIARILEDMWPTLQWDKTPDENGRVHDVQHAEGETCTCGPHAALRVQYLRLVHNFFDRDFDNRDNKRLLLSAPEMSVCFHDNPDNYISKLRCQGNDANGKGVLTLLVDQLLKEDVSSSYRFWLASCLESFLRGASPEEQMFVARTGLLKSLLDDLSAPGFKCSGANQTSFDLLGELMKFNPAVFLLAEELLDDASFEALLRATVANLVDSNVFVRALLLSVEAFREAARQGQLLPAGINQCRMARFLEANGFQLLRDLMTVVSVEDISQENICCLNTSLIFFIFARRRGELETVLASLREVERRGGVRSLSSPYAAGGPGDACLSALDNMKALTAFWSQYYDKRNKDCLSLQFSSRIAFAEWRAVVGALQAPADNPWSLQYSSPRGGRSTVLTMSS